MKFLLYFFIGGTVVSVVTYLASRAKGLLAAFVANLPIVTLITFLTIYLETGHNRAVVVYAEGLIIMLFPWLAYIFSIIFLTPRLGVIPSLVIGFILYLLFAFIIISMKRF